MVYIWTTCVRTHDTLGSIPMKGIYDLVIKSIARSQSLTSFLYLWWLALVAISPTEVSSCALCISSYPLRCLVLICHEFSFPTSCQPLDVLSWKFSVVCGLSHSLLGFQLLSYQDTGDSQIFDPSPALQFPSPFIQLFGAHFHPRILPHLHFNPVKLTCHHSKSLYFCHFCWITCNLCFIYIILVNP